MDLFNFSLVYSTLKLFSFKEGFTSESMTPEIENKNDEQIPSESTVKEDKEVRQ